MHENLHTKHSVFSAPDRQTDRGRERQRQKEARERRRERQREKATKKERERGRVHFTLEKLFPALISKAVSTQKKVPAPNPFHTSSLYSLQTTSARLHRV